MMVRWAHLAGIAWSLTLIGSAVAGDTHDHSRGLGVFCPRCAEPCFPTVSKGKTTKKCFSTERRAICIPAITFPWQRCNGGCDGKSCKDQGCARKKSADKGCSSKDCGGKGKCPEVNCQAPAKCGRIKYVNVLWIHEYECSTCKYSWNVNKDAAKTNRAPNTQPVPAKVDTAGAPNLDNRRVQPVSVRPATRAVGTKLRLTDLRTISD